LHELDPVIHQPTRLKIMGALYKNRRLNYKSLRDGLQLTDGNLASHAQRLEQSGYVEARRVLVGVSFEVVYRITPHGSEAFRAYLEQLRSLLQQMEEPAPPPPEP
jgi:DNA-binding MarR family transcriptional regulator